MQGKSSKLRRGLLAVGVLALFTTIGLVPSLVQAQDGARFTLPERQAGDRVDYEFDGTGGLPFMYLTLLVEEPLLWKDENGAWHRADLVTHDAIRVEMGDYEFVGKLASLVDAETWQPLASTTSASAAGGGTIGVVPLQQSQSDHYQDWGFYPGGSYHSCGNLNGLQGSTEWSTDIVVGGECGFGGPVTFTYLRGATWKDQPAMVYGRDDVELTFAPGIPYPVEMRFIREGGDGFARLAGVARGTAELRHAAVLPSPTPLPAIESTTADRYGPDLGVLDAPYPIESMIAEARDDPTYSDVRDFMAAHPDWRVTRAELLIDGDVTVWDARLSSISNSLWFRAERSPTEVQGMSSSVPGTEWSVSYHSFSVGNDRGAPPLDEMDASVPSAESVAQAWQVYNETDNAPNAVGFSYGFCIIKSCSTSGRVMAGEVPIRPDMDQETPLGLQDPPQDWDGVAFQLEASNDGIDRIRMITSSYERGGGLLAEPEPSDEGGVVESGIVLDAPAAAVGLFAGVVAAVSVYFWPVVKTLPGLSLFSRLKTPQLLEHPARRRIMDAIEAHPGIHFKELQRRTELANGTLRHHVRYLAGANLVQERQQGGFTCYYAGKQVPADLLAAAPLLKSPSARKVLDAIKACPGISVAELAKQTGLAIGTIGYHVKRFKDGGLVEGRFKSRTVQLYATDMARRVAAA